ncbi:MAG: xylulokinase [Geminicoccaceae bacterium]
MAEALCLGIDLGTSGVKVIAVDAAGTIRAAANRTYPLMTPKPGWTEQDPDRWWAASLEAIREVAEKTDEKIVSIGLTGQMHGSVFLDTDKTVIRPALLWNDQRTADDCAAIEARLGREHLTKVTGNPALTGFQAPKMLWLRRSEPEAYARLAHLLLPKDFLRLRLTGAFATDCSDAAGTLLLDLRARDWSPDILEALAIDRAWLPDVYEGPEVTGHLSDEAAGLTGLTAGLPVIAGGGDNAAAAVGCGVIRAGTGFSSLGTSGVTFVHSDEAVIDPTGALHAFCHAVPGAYHLMGVVLSAAGSLRWYAENISDGAKSDAELAEAASRIPAGCDGLTFLPYLAGERTPHMDPDARGAWVGLTLAHNRDHLVRSILEGVAFAMADSVDLMRDLKVEPETLFVLGGGARSGLWRQLVASSCNVPLQRMAADEGPAMGAAILAMVGAKLFSSLDEAVDSMVRTDGDPDSPEPGLLSELAAPRERFRKLYPALRSVRASTKS